MVEKKEFSTPIRVYIEDTDAGGVVYYVNYLKFMERARTEFLRDFGIPKPALLTDELLLVVASANVDYKRSARLDDLLHVTAEIEKQGRAYVIFRQRVLRESSSGELELMADGLIKVACVSKEALRPMPFPEFLTTALAGKGE